MTKIRLKFNVNRYMSLFLRDLKIRMKKVAALLAGKTIASLSISNRNGRNPSMPGEVPHVSGKGASLNKSIRHAVSVERNAIVGMYGVPSGPASKYARRLELGFFGADKRGRNYNQAARPFLVPQLRKNQFEIRRIITGG